MLNLVGMERMLGGLDLHMGDLLLRRLSIVSLRVPSSLRIRIYLLMNFLTFLLMLEVILIIP
jgi:hypothetical protein